jgi:hypothetical protein
MRIKGKGVAPRKLLVAAIGVATVNYAAACGKKQDDYPVTGNLPAPVVDVEEPPPPPTAGNLPAPEPLDAATPPQVVDAGKATAGDGGSAKDAAAPPRRPPTTGNLPAPPPRDR